MPNNQVAFVTKHSVFVSKDNSITCMEYMNGMHRNKLISTNPKPNSNILIVLLALIQPSRHTTSERRGMDVVFNVLTL